MPTVYQVQAISAASDQRPEALQRALEEELRSHGLQGILQIEVVSAVSNETPNLAVFFGNPLAAADERCIADATTALDEGRVVIPLVDAHESVVAALPQVLKRLNALLWEDDGPSRLARAVLEDLGIEERQRRVFISHKREDGLLMAEQLHDELTHHHFQPFIDRFAIAAGEDIQSRIADALEDFAYLLLIESPKAAQSEWVFYESSYALSHYMGLSIISWPDAPELPGTHGLPRVVLSDDDLYEERSYRLLTPKGLARVVAAVEESHARGIVRRKQNLMISVQEALDAAGRAHIPLTQWSLLLTTGNPEVIGVAPRLPTVEDLYHLDQIARSALTGGPRATLVHAARRLTDSRRELLQWAAGDRSISLVPENAVGAYW